MWSLYTSQQYNPEHPFKNRLFWRFRELYSEIQRKKRHFDYGQPEF